MQLLEHFKALTLHPKNAEELKGLILQLAVQGRLTRQWRQENPNVEPASVLLEKIKKEKAGMISINQIPKEKPFPRIKAKTVRYELPTSWLWCNLGEVVVLYSGRDLTPNEYSENELGYPYLTGASQIKEGEIILNRWTDTPKVLSFLGDVLISVKGTIGKTVINAVGEIHIARQIMALRSYNWNDNQFLKLFSESYLSTLQEVSNGIIPGISREHLLHAEFPLPPLEEQKAIVEVVNQLFAEVEQLEDLSKKRIQLKTDYVTSALQQLTQAAEQDTAAQWDILQKQFGTFFTEKENIKKLRESILQLAVQGKLTRDWRLSITQKGVEVEPAATLLERIKAEKAQLIKAGKIKKEKPLPEIMDEEIPYELPEGWVWCRLGKITTLITDGKHGNCQDEANSGYYFLSAKDVQKGKLLYNRARQINYKEFSEVHQRTNLEPGDLCIVNTGATVGKTAIALENDFTRKSTFQKSVAVVKILHQFLDINYLENFIIHQTPILLKKSGGSAINNLLLGDMQNIVTPLPSFEEQKAIVEKVNALMGFCDRLDKEIETQKNTQEQRMKSCLREVV